MSKEKTKVTSLFFDEYVQKLVKFKAGNLAEDTGKAQELDDIIQRMYLKIASSIPKYDSKRASIHTYVDRILNYFCKEYVYECRQISEIPEIYSLEASPELKDYVLAQDEFDPLDRLYETEFSNKVEEVIAQQHQDLQGVWRELSKNSNKTQVAKKLGISRNTLYDRLKMIKDILLDNNIKWVE